LESERWPELADLLGVDVSKSLAPILAGTIRALPWAEVNATPLELEIERRGVDLTVCAEFLRGIAAAISRHVTSRTYMDRFSLESCFLSTVEKGSPPLADTHLFVAPERVGELIGDIQAEAHPLRDRNLMPTLSGVADGWRNNDTAVAAIARYDLIHGRSSD